MKVVCKKCKGTRSVSENVSKWQCQFCMTQNRIDKPEPIIKESLVMEEDKHEEEDSLY